MSKRRAARRGFFGTLFFPEVKKVLTKHPGSSMIIKSLRGTNAMKRKVACRKQGFFVEYVRTGRICRSRIGRLGNWRRSTPVSMAARLRSRIRLCFRAKRVRWFPWDRIADFERKGNAVFIWERKEHADGCTRYRTLRKEHHNIWKYEKESVIPRNAFPPETHQTKKRCLRRKTKSWHSRKKSESV